MFSLKWSAMSAAFGFILSLLLSLVSGAGIVSLIRALIFGASFFVLSSLLYWMVKRFLPEFDNQEGAAPDLETGSQVDISLGADDDVSSLAAALQEDAGGDGALEDPSGFEGFGGLAGGLAAGSPLPGDGVSGGGFPGDMALDQDGKNNYNNRNAGVADALPAKQAGPPPAAVLPVEDTDVLDVLPGLEGPSQFSPSFEDIPREDGGAPIAVAFPGLERSSITPEEGEEFRGKEKDSALAIQTILKRN